MKNIASVFITISFFCNAMEQTIPIKPFRLLCAKHISPDGRYLAVVEHPPRYGDNQLGGNITNVYIWDVYKNKEVNSIPVPLDIFAYAWTPLNESLAVAGKDAANINFLFLYPVQSVVTNGAASPSIMQLFKNSHVLLDILPLPDNNHVAIHSLKPDNLGFGTFCLLIYNCYTNEKIKIIAGKKYMLSWIIPWKFFHSLGWNGGGDLDYSNSQYLFNCIYSNDGHLSKIEYLPNSWYALAGPTHRSYYTHSVGQKCDILTMMSCAHGREQVLNSSAITPEGLVSFLYRDKILVVDINEYLKMKPGLLSDLNRDSVLEEYSVDTHRLINYTWSPTGDYLAVETSSSIVILPRTMCKRNIISQLMKREIKGRLSSFELHCPK